MLLLGNVAADQVLVQQLSLHRGRSDEQSEMPKAADGLDVLPTPKQFRQTYLDERYPENPAWRYALARHPGL